MKCAEWLLEHGADPKVLDLQNNSLLHKVSSAKVCQMLLSRGLDPNALNANGMRPLHMASANNHLAVVTALVSGGANPDLTSGPDREAPLHAACRLGLSQVVKALVKTSADVSARDGQGPTPLLRAVGADIPDDRKAAIVKLLLDAGAQPENAVERVALQGWAPPAVKALLGLG